MRLVILENNLREQMGHFLNSTIGLANAAKRNPQFRDIRVFCHKSASKDVLRFTGAVPLFRHLSWQRSKYESPATSMQGFGKIYAQECRQIGDLAADDVVMVPTSQENQVFGLALYLATLADDKRPTIVLNFHVDNWTAIPQRSAAIRTAFSFLDNVNPGKVFITAPTPELVNSLSGICGRLPVRLYPLPQNYSPGLSGENSTNHLTNPTIAIMGRPIKRKGSANVCDVIRDLGRLSSNTRFLIQCNAVSLTLPRMLLARNVDVRIGGLSPQQYGRMIAAADIMLMPYSIVAYKDRTSGIFADCAAAGKVAVVPRDTWMARQITAGYAAGVIYKPGTNSRVTQAVLKAIENMESLRRSAESRSEYWWQNQSANAYIEKLAAEINVGSTMNVLPLVAQPNTSEEILIDSPARHVARL